MKTLSSIISTILWLSVSFGSLAGVAFIAFSFYGEFNAIQQTSAVAIGIACAVIPYCFARAFSEIVNTFTQK